MVDLVKREYGISSLDDVLKRHLDLALNIAHGGITLDQNPEELQRDHIFPRSQLEKAGYPHEVINHYANFHFLRGTDNLNKLDRPPDEWFRNPGKHAAPYSEDELADRLLTWGDLAPGGFDSMIEIRGARIRQKAEELFGLTEKEFNGLFVEEEEAEPEDQEETSGRTDSDQVNAKRQQAVEAFGRLKGALLVRQSGRSDALFWSADNELRVCCAVSKRYKRAEQPYWYGFHPRWDDFLAHGTDGFLILACIDSNVGFAIPYRWIAENKKNLSMREGVGERHWHIPLTVLGDGALAVKLPRNELSVTLKPWEFSFEDVVEPDG